MVKCTDNDRTTTGKLGECYKKGRAIGIALGRAYNPPLAAMMVSELRGIASKYRITGYTRKTKAQLIEELIDAGYSEGFQPLQRRQNN